MADVKINTGSDKPDDLNTSNDNSDPPPAHPDRVDPTSTASQTATRAEQGNNRNANRNSTFLQRAFSKPNNNHPALKFFSAYAETWVGLSPLWLMGEAIIPGQKVGSRFNKGKGKLVVAAEDIMKALTTDDGGDGAAVGVTGGKSTTEKGKDVVVIIDQKLREGLDNLKTRPEVGRLVEVVKAAGCVYPLLALIISYLNILHCQRKCHSCRHYIFGKGTIRNQGNQFRT